MSVKGEKYASKSAMMKHEKNEPMKQKMAEYGKKAVAKKGPSRAMAQGYVEKKTGEKYKSRSAMMKHEKKESPSMRKKEYGTSMRKGSR